MKFQRTLCSYKGMTKRNIKVYLKDKTAIIFSMMTQIIILGLYLLFLKQNYVDSMTSMLDGFNIKTEDNLINALCKFMACIGRYRYICCNGCNELAFGNDFRQAEQD